MLGLTLGFISLPEGLRLEILGRINGVKEAVVRETAIRMEWHDKIVNVIHPLQLFIGKGNNLLHLDQSDRQDAKHFAIMQWVMRAFLAGLSDSRETLAPKALLACCESLIRFALENTGLRLILAGHMPLPVFWPDLTEHPSSQVRNFARLRVPRWQGQMESALEKRRARTRLPEP